MRVIYKDAPQGHAVPHQVLSAMGPFPSAYEPVMAEDRRVLEEFPYGATAQNGMQGVVLYECRLCTAVLREEQLDAHKCEER